MTSRAVSAYLISLLHTARHAWPITRAYLRYLYENRKEIRFRLTKVAQIWRDAIEMTLDLLADCLIAPMQARA